MPSQNQLKAQSIAWPDSSGKIGVVVEGVFLKQTKLIFV